MPRITAFGTARTGIAGVAVAALSLGAALGGALSGGMPVAQAADLYKPQLSGSGETGPAKRTFALAQRGNARAQAMLGFMYANGDGVPQSYDQAAHWYTLAAEQGDPEGQYLLGLMYDKGFGVKADVVVAHKWLNLAAAHASRQNRDKFSVIRDAVASKMTKAQLEAAQQLALDFVPTRR